MIGYYAVCAAVVSAGWGLELLLFVLIPARLGIAALAFGFDYLPHRPHTTPARVDRFQATAVRPSPWLTPLMLGQNFHLVHHLYPAVPFYRYGAVWRLRESALRAQGAKVIEGVGGARAAGAAR